MTSTVQDYEDEKEYEMNVELEEIQKFLDEIGIPIKTNDLVELLFQIENYEMWIKLHAASHAVVSYRHAEMKLMFDEDEAQMQGDNFARATAWI